MRTVPAVLQTHLDTKATTLAVIWEVLLTDGSVLRYTSHDVNIEFDGDTYLSAGAPASPTTQTDPLDGSTGTLELQITLGTITLPNLLAGLLDGAQVWFSMINWASPTDGQIKMRRGWLGEATEADGTVTLALQGLLEALQQNTGQVYSPTCRAELGDTRCGIDLDPLSSATPSGQPVSTTGTAESAPSGSEDDFLTLYDSNRTEADDFWTDGTITFTSGNNNGYGMEVFSSTSGIIQFAAPLPNRVLAGDTYSAEPGCDKAYDTCLNTYANELNFRGEPFVPGNDVVNKVPNVRSD